jgi:glutamate synthase (NADPH/NADH) large chain
MESAGRLDVNHQLSVNELPYIVRWHDPLCTRCGRCTSVCPVKAIEPGVVEKRVVESTGPIPLPTTVRKIVTGVRQVTDIKRYCIGCA